MTKFSINIEVDEKALILVAQEILGYKEEIYEEYEQEDETFYTDEDGNQKPNIIKNQRLVKNKPVINFVEDYYKTIFNKKMVDDYLLALNSVNKRAVEGVSLVS